MKIFDKESHKFTDIFPMVEGNELENLKNDIKEYGQLEPIILFEDKILDGRNRYRVCKELGLTPKTDEYKGTKPLEFVVSLNLKRRHLSQSQLGVIALEVLPMLEEEAKKRQLIGVKIDDLMAKMPQGEKGMSSEKAGKKFNVSARYVREAKKLKETSPELLEEVRSGHKNFSEIKKIQRTEKIQKQREEIQKNVLEQPTGLYDVIVIDPPWNYDEQSPYDTENKRGTVIYPTMKQEELKKIVLPLKEDAVVWVWVTNSRFKEAIELTESWGLVRKTIVTWDKQFMGVGRYLRNITEHCILCFKGKPYFSNTKWTTLISEKRTNHSAKPEIFYKMVDEVCAGRKLDYFARKKREGWDVYGDEIK